ncbi:hypothetical protein [Enterococcus moraviensis]|nr:hypothetical protein [Enterococcus moraviensis]
MTSTLITSISSSVILNFSFPTSKIVFIFYISEPDSSLASYKGLKPVKGTKNVVVSDKANGAKDVIKNNLGKEIDITPSKAHTKVNKNPGPFGEPNSSVDILDSKGELTTRRFYDETGKAVRDVDMTNNGNPKQHPEYPHEHKWKYDSNGKPSRE